MSLSNEKIACVYQLLGAKGKIWLRLPRLLGSTSSLNWRSKPFNVLLIYFLSVYLQRLSVPAQQKTVQSRETKLFFQNETEYKPPSHTTTKQQHTHVSF